MKYRAIRANYDEETITVYQAYRKDIAIPAVKSQTFVSPFKKERMTWIKPSFLWMMYRCGWAEKDGQEHILAIKIRREGFEWALANSCLSHLDSEHHTSNDEWKATLENSPVRIQWDPERDLNLQALDYRSIQIGLSGVAVEKYISEWIVSITDITGECTNIRNLVVKGSTERALSLLPVERIYELPESIAERVGASL